MGESRMSESETKKPDSAGALVEVTKPRRWSGPLARKTGVACVQLAIVIGIAWATARAVTTEVVTFDMKGTMDLFIQQTLAQKVPEEQSKVLMTRFNRAMNDSLQEWQDGHNAIILVAPAVVSRQADITQYIRTDIAQRMQSGKEAER
ncbi:type-F conjugative transfer system protein TrbI [Yokenella regensburgei]|uniref:type-F conjugative transfer system protein TrbI n=1 Tax=Yokenella regensburgei TaxID=158877 RepID=UPI0027D98675|nr:type-F conjugative transfer system protein TrbI [Yokenella regensburgei]MDQ4429104.1 type-F conjugative transfer system protein TrbI [Yokenella regensburgei]